MKKGALVVQAGSGATLDENALTRALESGHLGGAALDTYEYEPLLRDHPLVPMASDPAANVILTPHIAAATLNPYETSRARDFDEILRFIRGEPLRWQIH
jgi:D-3-phosphoglycerate dehydrogenase